MSSPPTNPEPSPSIDDPGRELKFKVAAIAGSLILSLVIAEVIFRGYLSYRDQSHFERLRAGEEVNRVDTSNLGDIIRLSETRELFYELKPNLRGSFFGRPVQTNPLGMRQSNVPERDKPANTLRVVGIGDSYMFGQGVGDGENFMDRMQEMFVLDGRRIEVLNFAVPGYNIFMEATQLETRAAIFEPDVIILSVTGNDWDLANFMLTRPYSTPFRSFLLGAVADAMRSPPELVHTPRSKVYEHHLLAVPEEVPEGFRHMVGFASYRDSLQRIIAVAAERDAAVVIFSDCVHPQQPGTKTCAFPFKPGQWEELRDGVYADPRVSLCTWNLSRDLLIPRDGHPTPAGHQNLAGQLMACLEQRRLLPR